ncbi:MAG: hypothetical protein H0U66_13755 [Gemmatimonadaceae bacterium]|nr:hypothetical protein [Gemmatimonadaceae bacterium]
MPRLPTRLRFLALLTLAIACNAPATGKGADSAAALDTSSTASLLAPPVMASSANPDSEVKLTVAAVTSDVIALRDAAPGAAIGKLPAHEQLVNGMLTNFEKRIRDMHVQADPAWVSVIDSVRTDLARLPAMKSDSLAAFLPKHLNRVMRIVACIQMVKSQRS